VPERDVERRRMHSHAERGNEGVAVRFVLLWALA
jgi:hypothetical protein